MKRRGLMHFAGLLSIVGVYLLVGNPASAQRLAAQYAIERLPNEKGVHSCQENRISSVTEAVTADVAFCKGAVGAFAVRGFGSPGDVQTFRVDQTVSGVLEFSNFREGLFTESIDVTVAIGADGSGQSDPFYVRGANLGATVFNACSPQRCAINEVSAIVVNVASLEWEELDSPLDENPNPGGGLRIFPDKTSPDDTVDRRSVLIKATLSSEYAGMPIYFRAFDVDDPSSDEFPIDANGIMGSDNRGSQQLGGIVSAQTDSTGVVRAILPVTLRPGDNYRIAAACDPAALSEILVVGAELTNLAGQALPTDRANVTPLLTVWRRLHIELESMGAVSGNEFRGIIVRAQPRRAKNFTVITVDGNLPSDYTRFKEARLTIDGMGSFKVTDAGRRRLKVEGIVEDLASLGRSFTLVDDDDFNDDDGAALDGDQGEDIPAPDVSLLQDSDDPSVNVFAQAYIRPTYGIGDGNDSVPFVLNEAGGGSALIPTYDFDAASTEADAEFWTVYLLGAYQHTTADDGDPGSEGVVLGIVDAINGVGANVFTEALSEVSVTPTVNNAATTAHEIGHLFGGLHEDGGLMSQSGGRTSTSFSAQTLNIIRSIDHP